MCIGELGNEDDPFYDFNSLVTPSTDPFKGEQIEVAQLSFYAQDEFLISPVFNLTYGLRVDIPIYITEPVDNPFSRGLTLLDALSNKIEEEDL